MNYSTPFEHSWVRRGGPSPRRHLRVSDARAARAFPKSDLIYLRCPPGFRIESHEIN
jgi:hypothetical protein